MKNTIDILISTHGSRIYNVEAVLLPESPNITYLIGHQNHHGIDISNISFLNRRDIKYHQIDSIGLTKSRNFLLGKSTSKYAYICDDDIILLNDFQEKIIGSYKEIGGDIITFATLNEAGVPRKKYSNKRRNKFNIFSISSIEITLTRDVIENIQFDEDLGCGTDFPVGEEAVFLSKALKKGYSIYTVNKPISIHPTESSGFNPSNKSIVARGVVLRRVYGLTIGLLIAFPYFIARKRIFKSNSTISSIIKYLKGFFHG